MKMKKIIIFLIIFTAICWPDSSFFAENLAQTMAGRILLQVESHGEAWYVSQDNLMRYYLGRPQDAFNVMRERGLGITNADIAKLPVGLIANTEKDMDGDGLGDTLEIAVGTSINDPDTDRDGFNDKEEITRGYNPNGPGAQPASAALVRRLSGRILLQVESHGEAWYLNPADGKRYFLGRPQDAFNVMRTLGTGISNRDLGQIETFTPNYAVSGFEKKVFDLVNAERTKAGLPVVKWNADLSGVAREHSDDLAEENKAFTGFGQTCSFPVIHHEGLDFGADNSERLHNRGIYYFKKTAENIALMPGGSFRYTYTRGDSIADEMKACESRRVALDAAFDRAVHSDISTAAKVQLVRDEIVLRTEAFKPSRALEVVEVDWKSEAEVAADTVAGWMASPGHKENILDEDYEEAGMGAAYVNGYFITTQVFIKRATCGFQNGPCCEQSGYYPYCFTQYTCTNKICQ